MGWELNIFFEDCCRFNDFIVFIEKRDKGVNVKFWEFCFIGINDDIKIK